jgi:hypothetical protein
MDREKIDRYMEVFRDEIVYGNCRSLCRHLRKRQVKAVNSSPLPVLGAHRNEPDLPAKHKIKAGIFQV